jgi:hypothetical protein
MKRSRTRLSGNPFLMWAELALKTSEMMIASAQVIGHRTGRMAAAGTRPNARDRREFRLMGQEKLEAAAESTRHMAACMMTMDPFIAVRATQQMLTAATAAMSLAGSRTVAQALARQAKFVRALNRSARTASRISGSSARLAQRGLRPIHARATANARRLGK